MRTSPLGLIFSLLLLLVLSQQSAHAQWILGVSSLTQNSTAHTVQGTSSTQMDYNTQLYYLVYVKGYIYNQDPNVRVATQEAHSSNGIASVNTQVSNATPGVIYNLRTEHYYWPIYPSCTFPGSCNKYDYYGYLYRTPQYSFVQNYGASHTFSNYGQYVEYSAPNYIWLGNTNTSIRAAPALSLTNSRVSGNLNGTTQNVLLGSPASLQASVTPTGLSGNYVWAFTGPFVQEQSSQDNSHRSIYWTQPGTYTATVTYSGSGFSTSASVTIQIRVPTLTQFSGNSTANVVDRGRNCSRLFQSLPFGASYSLGCSQNNADGMLWSATASIPNVAYLSDPWDAGIQFKQIVSVYRKRLNNGRIECFTARNPESNPETGWHLDGADPYHTGEYPNATFSNLTTTLTAQEFDAPATPLDRNNNEVPSFEREAVFVDDRFETYVQYFTGPHHAPTFVRLLHIPDAGCPADRFDCGVDRLVWRWGGTVNFDSAVPNVLYRQTSSTTSTGAIQATRTSAPRSYNPTPIQSFGYSLCQGAPNTTNPIDGTRFFIRQLYLGIFNREPDAGGWDYWLSEIAQCNVDPSCRYRINGRRHWVVTRFFASQETFAIFPGLANPPGSPGFDPNVYNPAFVNACYESFLDRDPDPGGYDYYMNILNQTADYNRVLDGFLESAEFRRRFGPVDPRY